MCGWGQGFGDFFDLCENVFFLIQYHGGGLSPRRSNFFISYKGKKVRSQNYSICPSFIESLRLTHFVKVFSTILSNVRFLSWHMTFTHFWFICCFFSFGCIGSSSTFPSFYLCRMVVWKLERNASSTSSTIFFPNMKHIHNRLFYGFVLFGW